jgi:hypothetical protein
MFSMRSFIITCSLIFSGSLFGQGIMRSAIGCMGTPMVQNQLSFQSILGQSSLTTNRHGFIQPASTAVVTPKRSASATPNPTQNFSTIEGLVPGDALRIIDYTGRIIYVAQITDRTMRLDFSAYESGVYHISIESAFEYKPIRIIKVE